MPQSTTVGRKVWYWEGSQEQDPLVQHKDNQPFDATVLFVSSDVMVNLLVFDHMGNKRTKLSVPLGPSVENNRHGRLPTGHATWMPYQEKQHAKAEAEQATLDRALPDAGTLDELLEEFPQLATDPRATDADGLTREEIAIVLKDNLAHLTPEQIERVKRYL